MEDLHKIFESFAPYILSMLAQDDEQRSFIVRIGKLCEKYNVSFISFMNIVMELTKQEASK